MTKAQNKFFSFLLFSILFLCLPLKVKSTGWCHDFLRDLKYDQKGEEIKALQIALEKEGLLKGLSTGYFGSLTFQAVKSFQEKYKNEILYPFGFKKGTGFVGIATRTKLNELYGCAKFSISSLSLEQGDTLIIKINPGSQIEKINGSLNSRKIIFSKIEENFIGILGISVKEKSGNYDLVINSPEGTFLKKKIKISERKFPITELLVTKELEEKGFTHSKIKEEVEKENKAIYEILQFFTPFPYFKESFVYPLEKIKVVGDFGNIRKSGKVAIQHLGVDLEATTGTPVFAINDGVVKLSKELPNYGKTIIIDHGLGIFSLYLHLNEFKVSEGQKVKRGEIIALSGNTGYSISPHLHFSIKINGVSVDPLRFVEIVEKEMIK
jgi:murein DD-endopeptidase MepM/ murein hydrolase activator NlpD